MKLHFIITRLRAAWIRHQIQRVDAQQRNAISDMIFSVDYRIFAHRSFVARSKSCAARKAALVQQLNAIELELV